MKNLATFACLPAVLALQACAPTAKLVNALTLGAVEIDPGEPIKMTSQKIDGRFVDVIMDADGTVWYARAYGGREIVASNVSRSTKKADFMSVGGSLRDTFVSPDKSHWYISDQGDRVYIKYPAEPGNPAAQASAATIREVQVGITEKPVEPRLKE